MEGAIAAGCRFYAGYPITPSSEIAERASQRLPLVGGEYIQMEDEIGSLAAVIGASCGGAKAMTATSGPGLSLMMEHIGLAFMLEAPCVIVDVQRGGPSTGLPTLTSQGDMMQARWGSHGDYEMVAYAPGTVQEMFDFAIKAFNAAETYRIPVMVMADQIIAQMTTKLVIPPEEEIETTYRPMPDVPAEEYLPFDSSYLVPPMALAGEGYRLHMTGLTHSDIGYPAGLTHSDIGYPDTSAQGQEVLVPRLVRKIRENEEAIIEYEERLVDDAEVGLVVYGSTSGPGWEAVQAARKEGIKRHGRRASRRACCASSPRGPFPGNRCAGFPSKSTPSSSPRSTWARWSIPRERWPTARCITWGSPGDASSIRRRFCAP
jgi:2-oxoglutarate ferredoxin oxidoreductase subunit alpha